MLASIRKFAKSWVAAILIGLLIVAFAIVGTNDLFKGNFSNAVIKAGSRSVSPAEFKQEFDNARKNAERQVGQPVTVEMAVERGLDRQLLQELATRDAFGEMLHKIGIRPSDTLIAAEMRKIPAFFDQISGRFDEMLFRQRLAENGLTEEKFTTMMRDDIAQGHLVSSIVNGLRTPRAYSALGAVLNGEARDVGYFTVDPASVPQPALPTDAQLTQFMKENAAQLTRPELRVLTVVSFNPAQVSANLPIDPAELQKRYDFRKDTLSQPETRSLVQIPVKDAAAGQAVAARLNKGEDPAAVAKSLGVEAISYVDKPRSAVADPRVGQAAFALPAGTVSAPIQGSVGYAVVKVTKVTPGRTVTLEEIRPQLEAELRKDAAAEKVYELTQAYEEAHSSGASLTEAAKKAGVPVFTIGPVTAQGATAQNQPAPGVTPKLLTTAFELTQGQESDVQEAGDGSYYAVRVDKILPKSMPPLAEVKPQLTRVWMIREMVKRLQARADQLAARVKAGESLEKVAASAGSKVTRVASIDRQNAGQNTALSRDGLVKAFNAKPGEVFTAENTSFGLIVAKLEAVRAPNGAAVARLVEDSRPQVTMGLFRELGEAARAAARKDVKVAVNPEKARAALGLAPDTDAAKGAAKTENEK